MNRKRITVSICGVECVLSTEDNDAQVLEAAATVEKAIKSVQDNNSRVSLTLASMITALSYYDDFRKATQSADNLRAQIKNYLEDASRARLEADEARREIDRMKQEIRNLRARLSGKDLPLPDVKAEEKPAQKSDAKPAAEEKIKAEPKPLSGSNYVKPTLFDTIPDQESFVSFFEKKED